ncbi:amidohydrolase [Sporomusa sp.]|uniref:amidohydrolase n=1 Tax=Sporomusa sp. TaxID=2078658 RepID=UPI002BE77AE9|nr:amidohydrolase [Sporomusa sp.]HWR44141.1 amidohydrolase [Sporomusa sp.]
MIAQPDLMVINARIWTGEPSLPYAEALAIKDDLILAIGSNDQIRSIRGQHTKVLDAAGHLVLPGFIDNHTHLMVGGFQLLSLDLREVKSKEEFVQTIAARAANIPSGHWITGGGWNNDQWAQSQTPVKDWIDSFTSHIPVFITRSDLHIGFANSAAHRLAEIDRTTANPMGGVIERDPYTGEPTGILKDNAMKLVQQCIPTPSKQQYNEALMAAMQHAARMGITSVQDITAWRDWNDWETFLRFQQQQKLTLRIYARTQITEWKKQLVLMEAGFCGDAWLRFGGVKGFVDGSLGSGTALMLEPYDDVPGTAGLLADQMYPEGIMRERIAAADKAGLPVSIHAIGDKANHLLLDIFEAVIKENGPRDRRFRIEHAQHLLPDDITRMARLGILASVQPGHVYEDGCWAKKRIGDRRCQMAYAFRSLLDAGVEVSFGTDWPVVPLNPFFGIYTAITRQTQDGQYPDGWVPEQKLSVRECLQAYTSGSAYAEFSETMKGTLRAGKFADLILVSKDVLSAPPEDIPKTRVLWTIAGGKIVYQE